MWIRIRRYEDDDFYIVNTDNISCIHEESYSLFLNGMDKPLHLCEDSMRMLLCRIGEIK